MGADPTRLKNFNGIYISPDQSKPLIKKKTGTSGVDIRYKMRDLEYASNMTSDDFFFGGGDGSKPNLKGS